jgi:hypothetical protein
MPATTGTRKASASRATAKIAMIATTIAAISIVVSAGAAPGTGGTSGGGDARLAAASRARGALFVAALIWLRLVRSLFDGGAGGLYIFTRTFNRVASGEQRQHRGKQSDH